MSTSKQRELEILRRTIDSLEPGEQRVHLEGIERRLKRQPVQPRGNKLMYAVAMVWIVLILAVSFWSATT